MYSAVQHCTVQYIAPPDLALYAAEQPPSRHMEDGGHKQQTSNFIFMSAHLYLLSTAYLNILDTLRCSFPTPLSTVYLHLCFPPVRTDDSSVKTRTNRWTQPLTAALQHLDILQHKKHNFGPQINEPYEETSLLR